MKRSEWVQSFEEQILSKIVSTHPVDGALLHRAAEMAADACGFTWDPEEPEVVWCGGEYRLLANGTWEAAAFLYSDGRLDGWQPAALKDYLFPVFDELARRLLAERERDSCQPTDDYWERTFWLRDPDGRRELPVNALRELELRRRGWVDDDPDAEPGADELAQEEKHHVTDDGPCWCNPVTEKPGIEELPKGDFAAVAETAAWIEEERESRDLGGEVRSAEIRPRLARIVRVGDPSWWYAKHVGKVFEVERMKMVDDVISGVVVHGTPHGTTFIVEREDVEFLEFLDLDS